MSAAISDVRPETASKNKIKKGALKSIELVENPDLLASLPAHGSQKIIVAFAAETDNDSVENAQAKMRRKGSDLIYLNNVSDGKIFGSPVTSGQIIDANGVVEEIVELSKNDLAHALINHAISRFNKLG